MVTGVYRSDGRRDINEDSLALEQVSTSLGECTLMIVADGIGSLSFGEAASGYIVECIVKWFYSFGIKAAHMGKGRIRASLGRTVYDIYRECAKFGSEHGVSMGSTCSMVCIWGKKYMCMQLGDSATYLIRHGRAVRLMKNHTDVKGRLNKCIGSMAFYRPETRFGRIRRGDALLVCSDGFTEKLSMDDIVSGLELDGDVTCERIEKRLVSLGHENERRGAKDNRSAVYVRI